MRFATSILALVAPLCVAAAPWRRAPQNLTADILVLQFADVLEQLETTFYSQALAKFQASDFTAAGFPNAQLAIQQFVSIQNDEAIHSRVLEETIMSLGSTPVTNCTFNFSGVLTDVNTMVNVARVVENIGVAAYLGAAHFITNPGILTAAGSIATVEARHQTILNILSSGSAIPQAFDLTFTPNDVLTIAGPFISGCSLPIHSNQPLTITNNGTVGPGTLLTFSSPALNASSNGLFCQMMVGGFAVTLPFPISECVVPQGLNGPVALWITSDSQPLTNNPLTRAVDTQVAGPAMAFIDTQPQLLGQLARNPQGTPPSTVTTINLDQATSIINNANSMSTPTPRPTPSPSW